MKSRIFIALVIVSVQVLAQPESLFKRANQLYQEQDYRGAAALYDSIIFEGYAHAETYYNLGNCHYRLGHVGLAILNYERALKLNPDDEDALHNLALTQKSVVDEFNEVPTPVLERIFGDISGLISSKGWSILALVFGLAMVVFTGLFLFKKRTDLMGALAIGSLVLLLLFEGIAWGANRLESREFAIIVVANTYVKSAPSGNASDLFILHEGTKVRILEYFEGWQKVKLPDGKIGWVILDDMATI